MQNVAVEVQTLFMPLKELKVDPANVRKTDAAPTEQFLASIREKGVLEPLTVRKNGEGYLVTNGGKRLASLNLLAKDGKVAKDLPVPCILRELDEAAARDISLTTNYMREAMHDVDEYEAFAALIEGGKTPQDIAREYGLDIKEVNRILAFGRLAPEVRDAWREEKIDDDAAKAFTLEPDQKRQAAILKKLGRNAWRHTIRTEILGEQQQSTAMLKFVGVEAYKAAGGATTQDLFTEKSDVIATDIKLLKKLYDEKLAAKIEKIEAEGWKFVSNLDDMPNGAWWWPSKASTAIKADDRGKYGVIYHRQHDGTIEFKYGVEKPAAAKAADTKKAKAKANGEVAISAALCGRLSQQITNAAAGVLAADHKLSLAVIAAAIMAEEGPAQIKSSGLDDRDDYSTFDEALALMRKKDVLQLHAVLAGYVATSLRMGSSHNQSGLPLADGNDDDRALLEALDQKKLNAQLRQRFDADDYFAGVTAQACKDAIAACDSKQPITGKEKKSELAKLAAELVKKSNAGGKAGWLPPEMRLKSYDGPALKAAPKPTAKAKTVKKVAKKAAPKKRAA